MRCSTPQHFLCLKKELFVSFFAQLQRCLNRGKYHAVCVPYCSLPPLTTSQITKNKPGGFTGAPLYSPSSVTLQDSTHICKSTLTKDTPENIHKGLEITWASDSITENIQGLSSGIGMKQVTWITSLYG